MKKFLYRILLGLNILCAACLLVAYISPFISPEDFWLPAFFGLAYPFFLIANLLFVLLWLIRFKSVILISLLVILAGWGQHRTFIKIKGKDKIVTGERLKILSYNVRLFNLYGWNTDRESRQQIFDFIRLEKPDIICFQDFFITDDSVFNTRRLLRELGPTPYFQFIPSPSKNHRKYTDLATFSSIPIINQGTIILPGRSHFCMFSDLIWNGDTIRIYNSHLQSTMLKGRMNKLYKNFNPMEEEYLEDLMDVSIDLRQAFRLRAQQVDVIRQHVNRCPYPVIICGDFNDTPGSYTYQTMKKGLRDAFVESGQGIGNTYRDRLPLFRIDHILHSRNLYSSGFTRHRQTMSDHYPISCVITKKE